MQDFGEYLHRYRSAEVDAGRLVTVMTRQAMWACWLEVSVEHELQARSDFMRFKEDPESDAIVAELRSSLVAISAAAHSIESVYGEIKYLVPPPRRKKKRSRRVADAFKEAFGGQPTYWQRFGNELSWLFGLRDFACIRIRKRSCLSCTRRACTSMYRGCSSTRLRPARLWTSL
jgi:hypothetical protein